MLEGLERFCWASDLVVSGHLHYDGHVTQILSPDWPVVFVYNK